MASWLTSAIQTMRDKSVDALDFVRRDLTEFTTTVKSDTETYINKIKTQEVADLGINRFVSKLNGADKPEDNTSKQLATNASFDRIHAELTRLQNDESTYLTDPVQTEAYQSWRETSNFNVDERKGEIAQLLIDAPQVRSFYAHLVPAQTTHVDFWSRYYFRVHQLEEEEERRTQLLRRAHEMCTKTDENTTEDTGNDWDEPEETPTATVPAEQHEEQLEAAQSESSLEKSTHERSESDTADSWDRDFDHTELASAPAAAPSDADVLTQSAETTTTETPSEPSTTTAATTAPETAKKGNEFEDEWDAWS